MPARTDARTSTGRTGPRTPREFIVVAYDVSNDRRRTKLHDALLSLGTPVQYSVFECRITHRERDRLRSILSEFIRRGDTAVCYSICRSCEARSERVPPDPSTTPSTRLI